MNELSQRILHIISWIPPGKVASYGQIASIAGNPRASRLVSRLLHSCTDKYNLPWHRVVNSTGKISLTGDAEIIQTKLLEAEGIEFDLYGRIDMENYGI